MDQFKPAVIKPVVTVADLEKLDVRVGTILSVEDVPKSSKLLRLTVELGDHRRTILAGMKNERADPQELVGRARSWPLSADCECSADPERRGSRWHAVGAHEWR